MGAPYNSFTFDNINSLTEGVYISGSSAFNAPERDVEMIVIPGRNGEFIRDNGRFNNIEVTYPCGVVGDSTDFKTKMQNIRNKLASKRGYCRLVDTYNPNEYRMGVFKDAIEVEPVAQNTAGQFEVVFNCKPQRFLTSGETKTTVTSGSTVTNPTRFDAQPMIMTKGYGVLNINEFEISIENSVLGDINLGAIPIDIDPNLVKIGDTVTVDLGAFTVLVNIKSTAQSNYQSSNLHDSNSLFATTYQNSQYNPKTQGTQVQFATSVEPFDFIIGTDGAVSNSLSGVVYMRNSGEISDYGVTINISETITYDSVANTITRSTTASASTSKASTTVSAISALYYRDNATAHSTVSNLGNPTYIDCELGEVYKVESGSYISLNRLTDLGSNLPVLSPGENEITYDNTFTSVEIIPHWWVV